MDQIDKILASIEDLRSLSGKTLTIGKPIRTAGKEVDLPMKNRIRPTDKEATDRDAMDKAIAGDVDPSKIDGIINEFVKEKILRNFQ